MERTSEATWEHEQVASSLPEIEQIEDEEIRQAVYRVWETALRESDWTSLSDAIKNPKLDRKLIPHVRSVTQQALLCAETTANLHGIPYSRDDVLVIALLHDVSKLLEYSGAAKSEFGLDIQHGVYAAHLMWNEGLPQRLIHAVISHTAASRMAPRTWEGILVYYVDVLDSDALLFAEGKPLFLQK
jgi:hypothetical protein